MKSKRGFSLIEVLISIGLMAILAIALMEMMGSQNKEVKGLGEKLGSASLKNLLQSVLMDGTVCKFELNNPFPITLDTSTAATIAAAALSVTKIHTQASATAPIAAEELTLAAADALNLYTASIKLTNFQGTGTDYMANWVITFDNTKLVRPLKPIVIPTLVKVDNTIPGASIIIGCGDLGAVTYSTVCGHGWAGASTLACCQINVFDGATRCRATTSTYPTVAWQVPSLPFAAGPMGRYQLACAGGSGGYNFFTCCQTNQITGVAICKEQQAWPSLIWNPLGAGNPF